MKTHDITKGALLIAAAIILPSIFHMAGLGGKIFLPMHIPVFLGGLLCTRKIAVTIGISVPLISFFITGMPPVFPIPIAFIMALELSTYAFLTSILKEKNIYMTLIMSMAAGRIIAGLSVSFVFPFLGFKGIPMIAYISGSLITGIPGVILQIILIPLIYSSLIKTGRLEPEHES